MLKLILSILLISSVVMAKPLVFDVCTPTFCYIIKTLDAKSWEWKTDYNDTKFVRVYLVNNSIMDITAKNVTINVRR